MKRRILYVTGTRADFGLMLPSLRAIADHPALNLELCVTGMHLSPRFGSTIHEVQAAGFPIVSTVPVDIEDDSPAGMARSAAQTLQGIVTTVSANPPDVLLVLGDRTEMLMAATAGISMGIAVAHLCGGERSGTIDDSMRHAISKLAHVHLVATDGAKERLIRMGEEPWRVHVVGAPGLVGLSSLATRSREHLAEEFALDPARPTAIMLFHPVVQDAREAGRQCEAVLQALADEGYQAVCLMPNADTGNSLVREAIQRRCETTKGFRHVTHLARRDYVSLLATADLLIGNSSSGIVEAASFGTPVVNVGDRQRDRERSANTFDAAADPAAVRAAICRARDRGRVPTTNVYACRLGETDEMVADLLAKLEIAPALFKKKNTY